MGLDQELFICLDCETTGLDPDNDRIIEVAAIRFNFAEILGQFDTLVDPDCLIPETSIAIHHITQDMVQGKPKIAEVLPSLLAFVGRAVIVGHGIAFDLQVIENAAKRAAIPCSLLGRPYIDTLRLARLYGESPVNSLEKLREHFNIPSEGAHRALSDALVNMEVFKQLARRYKNTQQILDVLSNPVRMKTMPLGKHKGRLFKEIPIEYLLWAVNKDFDKDLIFSLKTEIKRRRTGRDFFQSSNPFSNL